jgi:hypothetical protein
MTRLAVFAALALLGAGCGGSAPPRLDVGAVDDAVRSDPRGLLDQLTDSGLRAVGATSIWEPGHTAPSAAESATIASVVEAAAERDVRVFLAVYPHGSGTAPVTPSARAEFASYVGALVRSLPALDDVIVGNEPNLNRFWLPQFGPNGEDVAAPAYLALLAEAYDAAKSARSDVRVWGGATAPRGIDRHLYSGRETGRPVSEATQAEAYERALQLASCQPTVEAVLLFHLRDEPALEGWQSGVRLVDGKPKRGDDAVRDVVTDPPTCS